MKKDMKGTNLTTVQFRDHFKKVSEAKFENEPEDIEKVVDMADDLREGEEAEEWRIWLNKVPDLEEVEEQMRLMRDSAPGEDGVRLNFLCNGGRAVMDEVVRLVQFMFQNDASKWEESLKTGIVVPLYKMKGDREDPGNYRGVCLLSLGSRIIARVCANRLMKWAEGRKILDENQQGFRRGRSTTDASQMMMRIQEDTEDLKRRTEGSVLDEKEVVAARLLDLRKAYPRVNRPALWRLLQRYGVDGNFLTTLQGLHEATEYRVRGKEGLSEEWLPDRGLREGCPSSPPLFNIFHQAVMRVAKKEREKKALEAGTTAGIVYRWVPGSTFPCAQGWEDDNSSAVEVVLEKSLFADDTTVLGYEDELEEGVAVTKEVMGWFEERNNDSKEEKLLFGEEESGKVRMLGSWMGWSEDVKQRLKRGGRAWWMTKQRLKGSRISKKLQARIVEASVESSMLFDCQARTWRVGEVKKLQSFVDRAYRHIWSNKTKPPLMQMQEEGVNMVDVRKSLGVRSLRWKIEKRVYERMGHVLRMDDDRLVKSIVFGWLRNLEERAKRKGQKRKTVLYWRKLVREAGWDVTTIGNKASDRKKWKEMVSERMRHLAKYEDSKGKKWEGHAGERNRAKEMEFVFVCEVCSKVCKSKGGLTNHRRTMHEKSKFKKSFSCHRCGSVFGSDANMVNHLKVCVGDECDGDMAKCPVCGKWMKKKSLSKHKKKCGDGAMEEAHTMPFARKHVPKTKPCPSCGRELSTTNMARHLKICQN